MSALRNSRSWLALSLALAAGALVLALPAVAAAQDPDAWENFRRVVTFQDYNTRVVVIGTALLGCAAGTVGTFLLLRKRSLLSDAISHATLPGIVIAFLAMAGAGGTGKSFIGLLTGAAISGTAGMLCTIAIRRYTRLKDDAALGIVLSAFFAFGISLLSIASRSEKGQSAGLASFIYGRTASMLLSDAMLMAAAAAVAALLCLFLYKEFKLLCFDENYAAAQGWPVFALDFLLMSLVVTVTVVGLQAVGLILVVALLVIPPAAARFWTDKLGKLMFLGAGIGAVSCFVGSTLSALFGKLPAGAVIVLTAAVFFLLSLVFGRRRGLLVRYLRHRRLTKKVARQHLLRALFEMAEQQGHGTLPTVTAQTFEALLAERTWGAWELRRAIARCIREKLVRCTDNGNYTLTAEGVARAQRVVRNHRLWELYLIAHADIAPAMVDRGADHIEHVLDDAMIRELEALDPETFGIPGVPANPHHGAAAPKAVAL